MAWTREVVVLQAGGATSDAPPELGVGAALMMAAFFFVILIVPWIMARRRSDGDTASNDRSDLTAASRTTFSSPHERRLWMYAFAVVVAIYSTLSPAQAISAALRQRNLLGVSTGAVMVVVGLVIAFNWFKTRPQRIEIVAGLGVAVAYLTTLIRMPVPEARSHLFEYSLVATLVYQALLERRRNGRQVPIPALIALVLTSLLGWIDEGIQAFLPNRVYDLIDVGMNAAFALLAILANVTMAWARRLDVFKRLGAGARSAATRSS